MNIIRHFVRKPVSDFVGKLRSGLIDNPPHLPWWILRLQSYYKPNLLVSPSNPRHPNSNPFSTLPIFSSIQPVPRTHLLLRYLAPCHVSSFHLLLQHHQETALSPFPPCLQTAHTIFNLHNISRNKFPFWGWIANHIWHRTMFAHVDYKNSEKTI